MLARRAPCTPVQINVPQTKTTLTLKSASFIAIMRLHEGLTHIQSQMKPRLLFGESFAFRETFLTLSAVVKCDGLAFGAFPGCVTRCFTLTSPFLPPRPAKGAIYVTCVAIFSLSFFNFGRSKNLGICEDTKDRSGASSRNREKKFFEVGQQQRERPHLHSRVFRETNISSPLFSKITSCTHRFQKSCHITMPNLWAAV